MESAVKLDSNTILILCFGLLQVLGAYMAYKQAFLDPIKKSGFGPQEEYTENEMAPLQTPRTTHQTEKQSDSPETSLEHVYQE